MNLLKPGQFLYGIGIAALGIHQLITGTFRPDILPPFTWANQYAALPVLVGLALIFAGIVISGSITIKAVNKTTTAKYLAAGFVMLIIGFHVPYILFFSAQKISQLQAWFGVGEALAYCGGALLVAKMLTRVATILFSTLIILFGFSHFVYSDYVATMIPGWFGDATLWTYFVGVLLIGAGVAMTINVWVKTVSLLLAIMLFLFFIIFHVPDAIANPAVGGGNEIIRAIVCLMFCGIALMIANKG